MQSLPLAERHQDPLLGGRVFAQGRHGHIDDIEVHMLIEERLYVVKYRESPRG